jgi:hypothetical protein
MNAVTVPFTVTVFPVSYEAFPWCARRGEDAAKKPAIKSEIVPSLVLTGVLQGAKSVRALKRH